MNALTEKAFCIPLLEDRRHRQSSLEASFRQAQELAGIPIASSVDNKALNQLIKISNKVLRQVELEGEQLAKKGQEPAYHNRQHLADALLALGAFLKQTPQLSPDLKQLMLLVILVHDLGHRGLSYRDPNGVSHEEESVRLLKNTAINELSNEQQALIIKLVLGTTPASLLEVNSRYLEHPDNEGFLMQSLINDADIAASFIPNLAYLLTKLILLELGSTNPSENEIESAYQDFRSQYFITTSIAKTCLGL